MEKNAVLQNRQIFQWWICILMIEWEFLVWGMLGEEKTYAESVDESVETGEKHCNHFITNINGRPVSLASREHRILILSAH